MRIPFFIAIGILATSLPCRASEVPLTVGPSRGVDVTRSPGGVADLVVSGPSPHFWSGVVPGGYDPEKHSVLAFEYFSPSGLKGFSVRFRNPDKEMILLGTADIPLAEGWIPFSIDLSGSDPAPATGGEGQRFHFSFRGKNGECLQIRNFKLRAPTAEELEDRRTKEERQRKKEAEAEKILSYFGREYPGEIHEVLVKKEAVLVSGTAPAGAMLREIRPVHASHQVIPDPPVAENLKGGFSITLDRFVAPGNRDRALSRWRLESQEGEFLTASRWPDRVTAGVSKKLPRLEAKSQKGLGGIPAIGTADHEIFELGIRHATVNVVLNALLFDRPRPGLEKIHFEGKPFYLNRRFLNQRIKTVRLLREKGIIVTAILLVGNHSESGLAHPEAESRGKFAMPNLVEPRGTLHYLASLHVLANHFTSPETRISNWVVHNEVDQAGTWTNMGDQPLPRYLETYQRSARLIYHTMRLRDPHARVFISLTHHWTQKSSGFGTYVVRDMLDLFSRMGRVEGDYEWGVAYHPYPRNLRNPDSWLDADVTHDFDTLYITPKNFEVLPRYLRQEMFHYDGKPRGILFSEQGFNTPTLSEEDQKRQVAGFLYLFRRLPNHPLIEAFHLHRYKDMPEQEGGLRLGIVDKNGNRKLGWGAYRDLGTPAQAKWGAIADQVMKDEKD